MEQEKPIQQQQEKTNDVTKTPTKIKKIQTEPRLVNSSQSLTKIIKKESRCSYRRLVERFAN